MPDGSDPKSSVLTPAESPPEVSFPPETIGVEPSYPPVSNDKTVISKRSSSLPVAIPVPLRPTDVGRSLVGEMLGHFRLEEFVGGGGMGAVFRATDTMLGRTVAVKVVSNEDADEEMLRRFRNEAQSAARLDHPNIARVYYVGEDKRWSYIVFEFIEGVNIRDLVDHRGALPIAEAISYTLQVSEALEHAAQRDVVHRDIKPSNILVMPDGRAKLVDMGLARLHQVDAPSQDLTATGVTLGTFDYISPEQARDPRSADVRSDLYSLGCTLYYMLTGMPPFPEGTVLQKLLSHSSDPPPDPRELRSDLNDELCSIALKLMAKQPGQRYQTPAELTQALIRLSAHLGLTPQLPAGHVIQPFGGGYSSVAYHLPWVVPFTVLCFLLVGAELVLPKGQSVTYEDLRRDQLEAGLVSESSKSPTESSARDAAPDANSQTVGTKAPSGPPQPTETVLPDSREKTNSTISTTRSTATGNESSRTTGITNDDPAAKPVTNSATGSSSGRTESSVAANATTTNDSSVSRTTEKPTVSPAEADSRPAANELAQPNSVSTASNVVLVDAAPTMQGLTNSFTTFERALRATATQPGVDTIELRSDQRLEGPLTIAARNENFELTVRGVENDAAVIHFQPSAAATLSDYSMLRVLGGKVNFVGIHFVLDLAQPLATEWSLFHLKQVKNITFRDCTLTIRNDYRATASFFYIEGATLARMMPEGMPSTMTPLYPTIDLNGCIVRGQANVVRATEGLPFRLTWEQGFLATTEPAVFARGWTDTSGPQVIGLSLRQVTASLQSQLCLIELDKNAPLPPSLELECNQCVFDLRNEKESFVEHRGIENLDSLMRNLYTQSGGGNLYSQNLQTLWRIHTTGGEKRDFGWRPDFDWYKERSSEKYTPWRAGLPGDAKSVYAYLPQDFLLIREQSSMAGFDEAQLPLPREPKP